MLERERENFRSPSLFFMTYKNMQLQFYVETKVGYFRFGNVCIAQDKTFKTLQAILIVKLFPPHDTQNKNNIIIIRTALVSSVFQTFLCSSKTVQTTDYSYWICTVRNTVSRIFKPFFSHRMRTLKVVIMDLGVLYYYQYTLRLPICI